MGTSVGSLLPWRPHRGFQRREYGLEWYPSRETLLESIPGPVLVGTAYEYDARGDGATLKQARKYSAFQSHWDYWDCLSQHSAAGLQQNLHEVLPANEPRCLYFDCDGPVQFRETHGEIMNWLRLYVRWFFCGDRLGWEPGTPEPVVLTSSDPDKYSCHVVFPEVQFRNYAQQCEYLPVLLSGLPALVVDLEGGVSVPILERVVDRVPYSQFQLFRGPYACKLSHGRLRPETCLEPEGLFRDDPLAYFAGRAEPEYALELPPVESLLAWNEELRHHYQRHAQGITMAAVDQDQRPVSPQDQANLYLPAFQRPGGGVIDLAGLTELEQYEVALRWLHPGRASQWWSWFRLSGVTCSMLELEGQDEGVRRRIWEAHFAFSSGYPGFDAEENVEMVEKGRGRRTSGLPLLLRLVRFDNPNMQVRTSTWQHALSVPRGAAALTVASDPLSARAAG